MTPLYKSVSTKRVSPERKVFVNARQFHQLKARYSPDSTYILSRGTRAGKLKNRTRYSSGFLFISWRVTLLIFSASVDFQKKGCKIFQWIPSVVGLFATTIQVLFYSLVMILLWNSGFVFELLDYYLGCLTIAVSSWL